MQETAQIHIIMNRGMNFFFHVSQNMHYIEMCFKWKL